MKKGDLAKAVANSANISEAKATETINAVFATIQRELMDGGDVNITGFGSFKTTSRPGRIGRNPQTGAPIEISPSTSASFKASSTLKKALTENK